MFDYSTLTDEELSEHLAAAYTEERRRQVIARAESESEKLAADWSKAVGRSQGDEWSQPQGSYDAYLKDSVVSHNGKSWVSLTPANVWEPGVSGWREYTKDGDMPSVWLQPTGAHDAYSIGDRVTFDSLLYVSTINGNVWSPADHPAGWDLVEEPVPDQPEEPIEEPVDPPIEEPVPDQPAEFVQPTGGHDAYQIGDLVTFEGKVYKSLIGGNVWSPIGYPAGWELVS